MSKFNEKYNLAEWALNHKQLVYYFIAVILICGLFSYKNLGRMEDPDFTIRQMIVSVSWPGSTAREMEEQVTDKIEKKLQDTPGLDYVKSYSTPGKAVVTVVLKDTVDAKDVRSTWLEVRNLVNDMQTSLPDGVAGISFNDRFDDVYGCIYALTGDGYSYEDMRERAEKIRRIFLTIPTVKKANLLGVQAEKIYIEIENSKLAQLGIDPNLIVSTIQAQNAMASSGMLDTSSDNVYLRVSGMFENLDDIRNLPIRSDSRTFRLGDIAKITRSYDEPADPKFFYNGQPAVGIELSMEKNGNILDLAKNLDTAIEQIKKELPLGLEMHQVASQPKIVEEAIDEFVDSLMEAVIIVLAVCFFSLGISSGFVVALGIPLIIAGTFVCMYFMGIPLHKISLGALIISLGLLVDDEIIDREMMQTRLEQGWDVHKAATYAYTVTAFPMLIGTLVTCAGFIPVGFSKGPAAEFAGSIFTVITISLLISWIVTATVTPLLGYLLVKFRPSTATKLAHKDNVYDTKFYRSFKQILIWCLHHRKIVLSATVVCFVGSIALLGIVKKEFFPDSTRPEVVVSLTLPEGSAQQATEEAARAFAERIGDDSAVASYSYYVGQGAPRFVLSFDVTFAKSNYAEFVIVAKDQNARVELTNRVYQLFQQDFAGVRGNIKVLQSGPPNPYPVMLRVSGYEHDKVREIAGQVRAAMAANANLTNINCDWDEKSPTIRLQIDQDKARVLGVASKDLATSLQSQISGSPIAEFRENDKTVNTVFRVANDNHNELSRIKDMNIHIGSGKYVPLDQIAKITYDAEEGLIWRRDLKPTITVQANIIPGIDATGNDIAQKVYDNLADVRANLPFGYRIELGGPLEGSDKARNLLLEPAAMMIFVILTLLMFYFQNIPKMVLILLTAPLGMIGVSLSLLLTGRPMGFVVQLGILALSGIIIRNSIILIDQIDLHLNAGESMWDSIINSTILRFRPIMLTAAAAILGMLPLMSSIFWGPMAVALAGGLFIATILTLIVLPVMYAAWYKAQPDHPVNTPAAQPVTMD